MRASTLCLVLALLCAWGLSAEGSTTPNPLGSGNADGQASVEQVLDAGAGSGEAGRQLLAQHAAADAALLGAASRGAANRTNNYTTCDATCHKHVMWMQGLIVLGVVATALFVGVTCMHLVDVPSRFAQPEAARAHGD